MDRLLRMMAKYRGTQVEALNCKEGTWKVNITTNVSLRMCPCLVTVVTPKELQSKSSTIRKLNLSATVKTKSNKRTRRRSKTSLPQLPFSKRTSNSSN